jgi:WD40 repeat protein
MLSIKIKLFLKTLNFSPIVFVLHASSPPTEPRPLFPEAHEASFYLPPENPYYEKESYYGESYRSIYRTLIAHSKTLLNMIADDPKLSETGGDIHLPGITQQEFNDLKQLLKETSFEETKISNYLKNASIDKIIKLINIANYLEITIVFDKLLSYLEHYLANADSLASFNCHAHLLNDILKQLSPDIQIAIAKNLKRIAPFSFSQKLTGFRDFVDAIAINSNDEKLAAGLGDGTTVIWNLKNNTSLKTLVKKGGWIESVAFNPHEKNQLATGSYAGIITIWDFNTGIQMQTFDSKTIVKSIAFSPINKQLATGSCEYGTVTIWDLETGKILHTLAEHTGRINSITYNNKGTQLASGSSDKSIIIWDTTTFKQNRKLTGHTETVTSIAYSANGKELASGSWDKTIIIWNLSTGEPSQILRGSTSGISALAYSPDGNYLVSGSPIGQILVWDIKTGKSVLSLISHGDEITTLAFTHDGKFFVSGSRDKTIIFWQSNIELLKPLSLEEFIIFLIAKKMYRENKCNQLNSAFKKIFNAFPQDVQELAKK